MTERWRKKLEGIDHVGPSDEVYRRARTRSASAESEPPIPLPKTRTRVMTGVAAFAVFALAISLFVVPALRLGGADRTSATSSAVAPLWPWQTLDQVRMFQADPGPFLGFPAATAEDPRGMAVAFGESVIGWDHVRAVETTQRPSSLIDRIASPSTDPTVEPVPTPSTSPPFAATVFELTTCPSLSVCDRAWPGPGNVSVAVYQPIGSRGPWAVLEARSSFASVTPAPGTVLNGVVGSGGVAKVPVGYAVTFGFRVGERSGTRGCYAAGQRPGSALTTGRRTGFVIEATTFDASSPSWLPDGCDPQQPAYLFVIVTPEPIHPLDLRLDPLEGGLRNVWAFAAVPVVSTVAVGGLSPSSSA